MSKITLTTMLLLVLLVSAAEAKTWYYHDVDSSQIILNLCDSLVTVQFDSAYRDTRMPDLNLVARPEGSKVHNPSTNQLCR
jgi:hypothetical protein